MSHFSFFHESTRQRCALVEKRCPGHNILYGRLQYKREIALALTRGGKGPWDYNVLLKYAREVFEGYMQNIYLTAPPPPRKIIEKMLLDSYPAILTCIHARYFCRQGLEHNFVLTLVGPGGVGKTTFVTLLSALLGGVLVTSEDEILFGLMDMVGNRKWTPILVFDDINAIISKYWHLSKEERVWKDFFKMLDYMKDLTTVILNTARSEEGPPKKLRELTNYTGVVKILPFGDSLVYFVEWHPGTKPGRSPVAIDVWWPGLKLPEPLWRRIKEVRRLRSEILLIENALKRASTGNLVLSDQQRNELEQRLEELREQLVAVMQNRWGEDVWEWLEKED